MRKFTTLVLGVFVGSIIGVAVTAFGAASPTAMAPTPPVGATGYSSSFKAATPRTTALDANATSCTTTGGASCTVILPSTDMLAWPNVTIYVKNSGANTINDVLIEVSPDGSSWEEVAASTLDSLTSGSIKSVNYIGNYAYIRAEARASAASEAKVWVTAIRP